MSEQSNCDVDSQLMGPTQKFVIFFCLVLCFLLLNNGFLNAQIRFIEKFNGDLSRWILTGEQAIKIIDSKDTEHGYVLQLQPDGSVYALVKDSDKWGGLCIEGEVLFPDNSHGYLGLIYNYQTGGKRSDFGSIYIKGNGSYLRVNPHRDGNASRLMYEEYYTPLQGTDGIVIGKWHFFKAEVFDSICHFYVGDMDVPKVTFDCYEYRSGLAGFKPRVVGGPVWIDNIKITSISKLSYQGPNQPDLVYKSDSLLIDWHFIGPLACPVMQIERETDPLRTKIDTPERIFIWKPFSVDLRGAVITGKITEYNGSQTVAYFKSTIRSDDERRVILHFSTTDELGLWVNGIFQGFIYRNGYGPRAGNNWNAWYDFWENNEHAGQKIPIQLKKGMNGIVVRVRNGQYASGGFFVRLEHMP